jgi:4-amino-4-deoxy-L-arabinose transferase-like glycosyltransferase
MRKIKKFDRVAASLVIWSNAYCSLTVCSLREKKLLFSFALITYTCVWYGLLNVQHSNFLFSTLSQAQNFSSHSFFDVLFTSLKICSHMNRHRHHHHHHHSNVAEQEMFIRYTTQETRKKSPSFRNVLLSTNTTTIK